MNLKMMILSFDIVSFAIVVGCFIGSGRIDDFTRARLLRPWIAMCGLWVVVAFCRGLILALGAS